LSEKRSGMRGLVAVATVLGTGALAMGILRPILPLYLAHISLDPALIGLIISVSMIGMVIGESFSGWVADRLGLRLPLIIGTVVCGLISFGFVLSQAVAVLFVVGFFWGLTRAAIFGPGRGYLADAAPAGKKATYLAITSAILALSRGVGALPGGFIADHLGYHWVFYVAGGVALAGGIAALAGPKNSPRLQLKSEPATPSTASRTAWRIFLRPFSLQCAIAVFTFVNMAILLTYVPLLGTQIIGVSATDIGIVFTVNGLATMAFSIPLGMAADRIGKRVLMVLGLLVCAGTMVGLAFAGTFSWLIILGVVHAFGTAAFSPSALGLLSEHIPAGRQATAMGLYGGVCENSGLVAGSAIGGFIWQWLGPPATFYTGAIACGLGIVLCLLLPRLKNIQSNLEECC